MNVLLIAGTDAGVGKTVLTTALIAYWQRFCTAGRLGVMKLVQCGAGGSPSDLGHDTSYQEARYSHRNDRELYSRLFSLDQSPESINPLYFQTPCDPPIAAEREGRRVELEQAWQQLDTLSQQRDFVLVESWGGLGAPITPETTMADLAWDWRIPVVLVVPVLPGAIAQTVANVALAAQSRLHLKGIVLNCVQSCRMHELEEWANVNLIQSLTHKPVLGCIPHLTNPTDLNKLAQVASNLDLERMLPLS